MGPNVRPSFFGILPNVRLVGIIDKQFATANSIFSFDCYIFLKISFSHNRVMFVRIGAHDGLCCSTMQLRITRRKMMILQRVLSYFKGVQSYHHAYSIQRKRLTQQGIIQWFHCLEGGRGNKI